MPLSEYDKAHVGDILDGSGDWYSAFTLRFLNKIYFKADTINKRKLWAVFSEEIIALLHYNNWPEADIRAEANLYAYH